jgi:hypothetical protein
MGPEDYPPTLIGTGMSVLCAVLTLVLAIIARVSAYWRNLLT